MRGWLVLACSVLSAGPAVADSEMVQPSQLDQPWVAGVNELDRARAFERLEQGKALYAKHDYLQALQSYEAALAIWDHPLIRYHQAVALLGLDRLVEAANSFDRALRFGPAPFTDPEIYSSLLSYNKLVGSNVGTIEVSCTHANAQMTLDGKPWFTCPGTQAQRVLTGKHEVRAQQAGYTSRSQSVIVGSDTPTHVDISLMTMDEAYEEHRRFPTWLPWSVLGAGVAAAAVGVAVFLVGQDKMNEYDQAVASECAVNGCDLEGDSPVAQRLNAIREEAELYDGAGVATMLTGTAVLITGAVLLYFNRPTRRLRVDLAPTSGGATAVARWTF